MKIGEITTCEGSIVLNEGRPTVQLSITNTGDRPVQVGSHYHFFETNRCLAFDRPAAYGMRLDIPSGTSVRFEPGETKDVTLTQIGGAGRVFGFNDLTRAQATEATKAASVEKARLRGFIGTEDEA